MRHAARQLGEREMRQDLKAQPDQSRDATPSEVMRALIIGAILGLTFWALVAWVIAAAI